MRERASSTRERRGRESIIEDEGTGGRSSPQLKKDDRSTH